MIKKGSKGMDFHNYANRIKCLKNFDTFEQLINECKKVDRFMVKKKRNGNYICNKDKIFATYFPNGILSLPYGHPSLTKIHDFKTERGQKIEKYFWEEKEKLLDMEKSRFKMHQDLEYLTKF